MVIFKSFSYALKGLRYVIMSERNARIHLVLAVLALLASIIFNISLQEWLFVAVSITLVFFAEIVNTAIEKTLDLISQENNQMVRMIKDMMAAAVLVTAITAFTVASVIFVPRIYDIIRSVNW
ncbi:MAG: diacylglycerol kinase family protein [Candidatus Saccharibacteria bacterium]